MVGIFMFMYLIPTHKTIMLSSLTLLMIVQLLHFDVSAFSYNRRNSNIKDSTYQVPFSIQLNTRFISYRIGLIKTFKQWHIQLNSGFSKLHNDKDPLGWNVGISSKYIPRLEKKLNFYFIGSLDVFNIKRSLSTNEERKNTVIQGTLGYGFFYQIFSRVSFNTNFGLGLLIDNTSTRISIGESRTKIEDAGLLNFGITLKL